MTDYNYNEDPIKKRTRVVVQTTNTELGAAELFNAGWQHFATTSDMLWFKRVVDKKDGE